jgi:hypothetical protein
MADAIVALTPKWKSQRLKTLACTHRLIALEQTTRFTGGHDFFCSKAVSIFMILIMQ